MIYRGFCFLLLINFVYIFICIWLKFEELDKLRYLCMMYFEIFNDFLCLKEICIIVFSV